MTDEKRERESKAGEPDVNYLQRQRDLGVALQDDDWGRVLVAIACGANPNDTGTILHRHNAVHLAIKHRRFDILEALLRLGGDPNLLDKHSGMRPLEVAARYSTPEALNVLMKYGADINAQGPDGRTALAIACSHVPGTIRPNGEHYPPPEALINVVRKLLFHGADPNRQDSNGNSSVHDAVSARYVEIVRLLLDHDADRELANRHKETPTALARKNGHKALVAIFDTSKAVPFSR